MSTGQKLCQRDGWSGSGITPNDEPDIGRHRKIARVAVVPDFAAVYPCLRRAVINWIEHGIPDSPC
jgi:hypothetical protein